MVHCLQRGWWFLLVCAQSCRHRVVWACESGSKSTPELVMCCSHGSGLRERQRPGTWLCRRRCHPWHVRPEEEGARTVLCFLCDTSTFFFFFYELCWFHDLKLKLGGKCQVWNTIYKTITLCFTASVYLRGWATRFILFFLNSASQTTQGIDWWVFLQAQVTQAGHTLSVVQRLYGGHRQPLSVQIGIFPHLSDGFP